MSGSDRDILIESFEQETEYFGFTPISYVDSVIAAVNEYLAKTVDALQKLLEKKLENQLTPKEIDQSLTKMVDILQASIDKNFDRFELYVLKNIFRIQNGIVLPQYQNMNLKTTGGMESEVDLEIRLLEDQLKLARVLNYTLQERLRFVNGQLETLKQLQRYRSLLSDAVKLHQVSVPVEEMVSYLAESLKEVKELSEGLRSERAAVSKILETSLVKNRPTRSTAQQLNALRNIASADVDLSKLVK